MLAFRLHMTFAPEDIGEAAAVLRSLVGPVRAERGCVGTQLLKDAGDQFELRWVEDWCSIEDFENHLRGPSFRQILAVVELASVSPVVEIDDVASRRGFGLVEEILGLSAAHSAENEAG